MTITFENDNDIIAYALERIISFAQQNQYLFVANCIWWIAGIIGLDKGLTISIENLEIRQGISYQELSTIPRNIRRSLSKGPQSSGSELKDS